MRKRTLLTSILGSAGVVIGLGAGLAAASIPDSGDVIHGCYKAHGTAASAYWVHGATLGIANG